MKIMSDLKFTSQAFRVSTHHSLMGMAFEHDRKLITTTGNIHSTIVGHKKL